MMALLCDRCGKNYKIYGVRNDSKKANGLMLLNIDSGRKYFSHPVVDLCPECMADLYKFLKGKEADK